MEIDLSKKKAWKKGDKNRRSKRGDALDRKLSADILRAGRDHEYRVRKIERDTEQPAFILAICVLTALLLMLVCTKGHAEEIINDMYAPNCAPLIHHTCSELADAIYISEGGSKTKYPYGILTHYKHTDARTACINTIHHQIKNWLKTDQTEPFLVYLARHYAPLNADNDPMSLNYYWLYNVNYWLSKGSYNG